MEKTCTGCKERKPFADFNKKSSGKFGLQAYCRQCSSEHGRAFYHKKLDHNRARVSKRKKELLAKFEAYKAVQVCLVCDEATYCCLEFHHLDAGEKDLEVSVMARKGYSWERVMEEIAKCAVLCSNCHKKLHAGLFCLNICGFV